ncbi:hypothetical protein UFOVP328_152 [uncultured Caudovirales phage]|uniref:Uncharacterized protein n=1 Tax=uncultured Caudovirales phage TaxID=2100421 RepID=A0A6J5LYH4_9CAUD|nr:hypothetical protein UFOVP328_152 [uncultured Caudovirales phage]
MGWTVNPWLAEFDSQMRSHAVVALVVERILGKDEVVSSNLINSTTKCPAGQIGKVGSLKRSSSPCSNQGRGTMLL